jgi:hypothetical protein
MKSTTYFATLIAAVFIKRGLKLADFQDNFEDV